MKQFFTLLVLVFVALTVNAQPGTIYRLTGTSGQETINATLQASTNGTDATTGFRRSSIWNRVNADGTLTAASPQSGATLQIFGNNLEITGNVDLSAFNFTILIRSEFRDITGSTVRLRRGRLHINDRTLTLGTNSSITLGWGIETTNTTPSVTYFFPGFLRLENQSAIIIGSTAVADRRTLDDGDSHLNANAVFVPNGTTSGAAFNNATSSNTDNTGGGGTIIVIRTGTNPPTINLRNNTATIPNRPFAQFPLFYVPAGAPGGTTAAAPLPVQLTSFNATKANSKVVLNWATAQELNSDYFEVQRSTDATNWTTVTTVKAAGNSGNILTYKAEDAAAASGNVYYRLKMVDQDATFAYSNIARLSFAAASGKLFAYPNPASSYTVISSDKNLMGKVTIEVINAVTGVRAIQQVVNNPGNAFRINTNELTPGNYMIRVSNEAGVADVLKLSKF